jgi:hypothetical protein
MTGKPYTNIKGLPSELRFLFMGLEVTRYNTDKLGWLIGLHFLLFCYCFWFLV